MEHALIEFEETIALRDVLYEGTHCAACLLEAATG